MKLNNLVKTGKKLFTFLLLINIIYYLSSGYHYACAEESLVSSEYYKIGKPNAKVYSLEKNGYLKLTENFMVCEFKCHDGSDKILIDIELVKAL